MANITFNPFNHNPSSVDQKTGSYSVPSTSYARVIVTSFKSDFTIAGDVVIPKMCYDSSFAATGSASEVLRNDSEYEWALVMDVTNLTSGTSTVGVFGPDADAGGGANTCLYDEQGSRAFYSFTGEICTGRIIMPPSSFIYIISGAADGTIHYRTTPLITPPVTEFWVPPSTALAGSEYSVELYTPQT